MMFTWVVQDAMGVCVQIGLALQPHSVSQVQLLVKSLTLCGSALGGMANTQRVVDFCHQHKMLGACHVLPDVRRETPHLLQGDRLSIVQAQELSQRPTGLKGSQL